MIRLSDITSILSEMSKEIGVTLVREQQSEKVPEYPFLTFNILSDNTVKAHQRFYATLSGLSSSGVQVQRTEKSRVVLSLSFHDNNRIDRAVNLCSISQQWFGSTSGIDFCYKKGYVVNYNGTIQNRTAFMDNLYWESKYGYDLNFDSANLITEDISRMNQIVLTPEPEGTPESDIIINT